MTDDAEERLAVAKRAASAGSEIAAESFRADIEVETKSEKTDVVTEADRRTQRRVIEVIREEYPDDAIVGEEEDELKEVPDEGDAWVIDPIDGTNNYVRSIPVWTTSVAAVRDGEPVAAVNVCPALGETYVAGLDGDIVIIAGGETTFPATSPARSKELDVHMMSMSNLASHPDMPDIAPILEDLAELLADDRLEVAIDRTYSLEEGAEAHRAVMEESILGKILVVPE